MSGEGALARADEAMARNDVDGAVAHLSAAIRELTEAGDACRAALACVRLGDVYSIMLGNATAARAWFVRARRLVEDQPPCLEQGWVAVAAMGCDVDDPDELLAAAELALDRARRFGDVNLEMKALADGGLAHVQSGRVAEGMVLLDEAMALACGPADDGDSAGRSVCSFFTACYHAADYGRAGSWADLLRRHGVIGPGRGSQVFLSGHCDSVQAALLLELGRWGDAEAVLLAASAEFERVMGMPGWHPELTLADLRIRQTRLAEAEVLLLGKDQSMEALLPTARLHLARGDLGLARATARRGLRVLRSDRLRAAELLVTLVDVELAAGDLEAAGAAAADLTARVDAVGVPVLRARAGVARSRLRAAAGDLDGAVAELEATLDDLDPAHFPWLRVTVLVELARRREAVDPAAAAVDAAAATIALGALDVVLAPADSTLLARLAGRTQAAPARVAVLCCDGGWWSVTCDATAVRLRDRKGLRYLAELVAAPDVERHALDLVDLVEGLDVGGVDRRTLGDAGPLVDGQARAAYRHRIEALREDVDDAMAAGRLEAAEAIQAELDQLVGQLAAAFGLGGRERRAASVAERARLNVTRALRAAIAAVAEALPAAGAVLDRRVRTGRYCAYEPGPDDEVRWIVQSPLNGARRG